ncbi:MAG: serine hydrolase [Actinomycetia bacterium]|nr:serine hydrolase [Actinomycetes bacterium]
MDRSTLRSDSAERLIAGGESLGRTDAVMVRQGGQTLLELYGDGVDAASSLKSWSMAKSILHAAVGLLVAEGRLDPDAPANVPEWAGDGDARGAITLWDLLRMRPGLAWNEDYVSGEGSDVIEMLFARDWQPVADTGGFAANKPLVAAPGSTLNYSSGTSNIVSRIVAGEVGRGNSYRNWLRESLFEPVGMESADPQFDEVGTWIASSYCFCTTEDFARFGELYLNGGKVGRLQVLDPAWVASAAVPTGTDDEGNTHTAHWWTWDGGPQGAYRCSGYEGQYIIVVPSLDAVVVRLGKTETELRHNVQAELNELIAAIGEP